MTRVLAVTSVGGACGIWNYAEQMIEAVKLADPTIEIIPDAAALDPTYVTTPDSSGLFPDAPNVVWLNHHRGLHSRWIPDVVRHVQTMGRRRKVVITFHDTYGERPPDDLAQQLHDLADAFVVHEPCEGLPKQILIRQGVPAWEAPVLFDHSTYRNGYVPKQEGEYMRVPEGMPILGTVGFNFPWKNFDRLAEVTAECGWAYLVASNNATDEDVARWTAANPWTFVLRGFQPTATLVRYLAACDATCFAYECANSGTSGAIRLGIAACKPVLAFNACRQFRDLWGDPKVADTIRWCSFGSLPWNLYTVPIQRVDPGIAYLAHRDSWVNHGRKYAEIFRGLAT